MNKPFTNKFGNQCLILEQFMLQPSTDQDRSTEHYFQKSTSVLDTLNQSDLFQHVPINTNATMEDQIYKVNISVCNWKGQQAYAIVLINITDETAIGEFKKLDSYKDSILATVSHDLKNPIGAIYQTLQFVQSDLEHLKHQNAQLEQVANFIDICLNNIQFLQSFVKDLSDFQQIKQQKLKLSHNYFDIIHLFHEVRQAFLFQLQLRQVEFQITKKVENPIVKNDETRLKQVLFNLISNSSKFTLNGQISLIVSDIRSEIQEFYQNVRSQMKQNKSHQSICTLEKQMSNVLLITISDTGVGISEDVQSQLFKSYSTFDNDKKVNRQMNLLIIGVELDQVQ
ncbi:hypothetical protein FGO68_gene7392 [Halteria grandinella]|uniref:Histidine kinase domain-containing protein n=1 Tax=Halteria grandinella TaxID=5974 RepID=A0A8J8SXW7_HALGN|nr:hypothetical protein FGO68_gene7392 [Halteria grandinella]